MLRHIRLLILDLDYLVFDCAALKVKALRESLISFADAIPHDVRLPDAVDVEEEFRDHGARWTQALQIGLDDDTLAQLQSSYRLHEERLAAAGAGSIYPGLQELLARCMEGGTSAALGAEASREYLLAVSDRHSLDGYFEMAYCTEEFGRGSAGEMIEEIMDRAEVHRSETLVLGTCPAFFQAGRILEVTTVGCGWGIQRQEALKEADLQALTVTQLVPALLKADTLAAQRLI
jgi:phosphoglycolate phosphatase-like HAD superfamily hydrolase